MKSRGGYSLLEVVIATFLMGLAIIPAMNFMSGAIHASGELETWNQMNLLAVSKLEEQLSVAAADFTQGNESGTFTDPGLEAIRFSASRSTSATVGGIDERLMVISVTVWHDENGNTAIDASEAQVTYATKLASMTLYQDGF
ncbi:type IV pilus modification PilV family protein [Bremerella sp. T1]|uniref:type IV pilus modification PilV family protein n=1 Tax=Bremerella sp. TYQ1 TaxID=3119568 RepID=UPI001CCF1853|nr:hypothetical protein [Bremerella volcania]UBM36565.1 hypothetical protein LA756_01370 [Bremerella volcania]